MSPNALIRFRFDRVVRGLSQLGIASIHRSFTHTHLRICEAIVTGSIQ